MMFICIPAWLQVKTLRVLQYFPPPDDPALTDSLTETLRRIITGGVCGTHHSSGLQGVCTSLHMFVR